MSNTRSTGALLQRMGWTDGTGLGARPDPRSIRVLDGRPRRCTRMSKAEARELRQPSTTLRHAKEVSGVAQHHTPWRSEGMLLNNNRSNGHSRLTKKEELRELRAGECCTSIAFVASRDTLTYLYGQQHVFDWAGRQLVRMDRCTENAPLVICAWMWRARELGISCIFSDYDGTNASTCTKIKLLEKNTVRKQGAHQDQIDGAKRHMQPQCHHRGRQRNHDSEGQHGGAIVTYRSIAPRDVDDWYNPNEAAWQSVLQKA